MSGDEGGELPPLPCRSLAKVLGYLLTQIILVPLNRVFLNRGIEGWSCLEQIFVNYVRYSVENDVHEARNAEAVITKLLNLGVKEPLISLKTGDFEGFFLGGEPTTEHAAILLYFHGGGYSLCSMKTYLSGLLDIRNKLKEIGKREICIFGLEYSRSPEAKYPTQINQAVSAYTYLREKYPDHPVFVMGDSAGGNLTLAFLLKLKQNTTPQPTAAILISPWVKMLPKFDPNENDYEKDFVSCLQLVHHTHRYLKGPLISDQVQDPLISPTYGKFSETCPLLIHYGAYEWLLAQIEEFIEKLRQEGIDLTVAKEAYAPHITPLGAKIFKTKGMNGVTAIVEYMLSKLST